MAARKNTASHTTRWSTHRPTQIDLAEKKVIELDTRHAAAMAVVDAIYAFSANDQMEHIDDDTPSDLALHLRYLIDEMHATAHEAIAGYTRIIGPEESEAANG